MKHQGQIISGIKPGSIAEELEIRPGDRLISINGQEITDIFDYDFLCEDEELTILIRTSAGEDLECEIEKDEDDDLGFLFQTGLMDEYRSCRNKCIFCFIDQMPPGMRETLYFKDDDSRLSFLQGNYVTLTNMSDADIERIIRYHLSPINISVHTMDPELRCRMLNNRFAGESLKKIDRLFEAGVEMNGQIVLCPGINDGESLTFTLKELMKYLPFMRSVSVVPVGLTRFRDGLFPLEAVSKACAEDTIRRVEEIQKEAFAEYGLHFVHASDEFYLLAEKEMPEEERYDGYLQYENGVGFIRLLTAEFGEALASARLSEAGAHAARRVTVATGALIAPVIRKLAGQFTADFPDCSVQVIPVKNVFFGDSITVAGLVTGQDLIRQLSDKELGDELLIPQNMLRSGETVFLDDITTEEVSESLHVPVRVTGSSGQDLLSAFLGSDADSQHFHNDYEPDF